MMQYFLIRNLLPSRDTISAGENLTDERVILPDTKVSSDDLKHVISVDENKILTDAKQVISSDEDNISKDISDISTDTDDISSVWTNTFPLDQDFEYTISEYPGEFWKKKRIDDLFVAKKWPQYVAAWTASIGAFGLGTVLGWTSPALPNIEERGDFDNLRADSNVATWIGAVAPLGCFFASFAAGFFVQRIGRKTTMLILAPPFITGWLILALAPSAKFVLVGRFMTGFCGGAFTLVVPIYVSETAEDSVRGFLCSNMALFIVAGILFVYIIGSFTSWIALSLISAIVPATFALAMYFMPETPRYLLMNGRNEEAREALKWLRGAYTYEEIRPEIKAIKASIRSIEASKSKPAEGTTESSTLKDLLAGPVLKPTTIIMTLMFLQQFGGINAVVFYSVDIFKAAGSGMAPHISAIIIATVMVFFSFINTLLVERLGRKILLLISELGMALSLLVLGVYFHIQKNEPETASTLGWLPLSSLIIYIITYNLGIGPLPWTLAGELLPPHVKGITGSIATAFNWGQAFLITKFFKTLLEVITAAGCYWFFSGCCFFGFVFCLFMVPETKGKSLDEIQRLFSRKSKNNSQLK